MSPKKADKKKTDKKKAGKQKAGKKADNKVDNKADDQAGVIIATHGQISLVRIEDGTVIECVARRGRRHGKLKPVCGDRIRWQAQDEKGVITAIDERRSELLRPDHRGHPRVVAANLDLVLITLAPEPAPDIELLHRATVVAKLMGLTPILLCNKADLDQSSLTEVLEPFIQADFPILKVSASDNASLAELRELLADHTAILLGQSGVGKSSLTQLLCGDDTIKVGELSERQLGKHTTTVPKLFQVESGGEIIDAPGVRDVGLWQMPMDELASGFVEFDPYLGQCRFNDCQHLEEPNCAVKAAVEAGEIHPYRYELFRRQATQKWH